MADGDRPETTIKTNLYLDHLQNQEIALGLHKVVGVIFIPELATTPKDSQNTIDRIKIKLTLRDIFAHEVEEWQVTFGSKVVLQQKRKDLENPIERTVFFSPPAETRVPIKITLWSSANPWIPLTRVVRRESCIIPQIPEEEEENDEE